LYTKHIWIETNQKNIIFLIPLFLNTPIHSDERLLKAMFSALGRAKTTSRSLVTVSVPLVLIQTLTPRIQMLSSSMLDRAHPRGSDEMRRLPLSLLDDCLRGVGLNRTHS
jgi:hypothetical protein